MLGSADWVIRPVHRPPIQASARNSHLAVDERVAVLEARRGRYRVHRIVFGARHGLATTTATAIAWRRSGAATLALQDRVLVGVGVDRRLDGLFEGGDIARARLA